MMKPDGTTGLEMAVQTKKIQEMQKQMNKAIMMANMQSIYGQEQNKNK